MLCGATPPVRALAVGLMTSVPKARRRNLGWLETEWSAQLVCVKPGELHG